MTPEELKKIISKGEGTTVEFKSSQEGLARSVYETICAFLNRRGGHIILGVSDNGKILGINPDKIQEQLDTLAKDLNNLQIIRPTCSFNFETIDIDGKTLIYFYVPEGAEGYCYKGHFYDRNQDGDFELRSTYQIANLFIRKSKSRSEDEVFPHFGLKDLDENTFDELRKQIKIFYPQHPWLNLSNEEILRSGEMIKTDLETGKEGITLAAILLFGKRITIGSALPKYRIDLLCRINDTELYDDREIIECNLIEAYPKIMAFIKKHLPEQPFIENMNRFSLRDHILREVALNLLIHREYSNSHTATLTIFQDKIVAENWNIPHTYGHITLNNLNPHRKNPVIAKVFTQMGIVEELGSGTRKMFKYTPIYAKGKEPIIEEQDIYHVEIPYIPTLQSPNPKRGEKSGPETTQKTTQKILELIKENPNIRIEELASNCEITRDGVNYQIRKLKEKGILKRIGGDNGGHWEITN